MLALGVPGSATAAVMMGGLMIWGLTPGPMLFIERPDFVWGLIASMYLGNIVAVMLVLATVPLYASILRVPFSIIGPVIVAVIFSRRLSGRAIRLTDIWLVLGFGLLGYVFKKLDYPLAPLVLAMVLGDKAEDAFRQSMLMSIGKLSIFWSNGLVSALMALGWPCSLSPLVFWDWSVSRRRLTRPELAAGPERKTGGSDRSADSPAFSPNGGITMTTAPREWNRHTWPIAAAMIQYPNVLRDGRSVQDQSVEEWAETRLPMSSMPASLNSTRPTAG